MKSKSKELEDSIHPSLKGYVPSEPIPDGYKLERLFPSNIDRLAIEFLVPIKENSTVKEEKAA